ncbi:MAG: hypothetical protein ABWY82_09000 [Tardiphaga sp.]
MPRPRPLAWSGARIGVQDGTSGARTGALGAQTDVKSGAQVQLPAQVQVQLPERVQLHLPAQPSNSTGSANSLIEPVAQSSRILKP